MASSPGLEKTLQNIPFLDPDERNDKNDKPLESHKNRTLLGGMRWYCLASSFLAAKHSTDLFLGPNGRNDKNDKSQPGRKNKNKINNYLFWYRGDTAPSPDAAPTSQK